MKRFVRSPMWPRFVILTVALLNFPTVAYWMWGGGWIAQRGFYDFAGGTAVHFAAGICALMGALIIGPGTGRVWGKPKLQLPFTAGVGAFLLLFGALAYDPAAAFRTITGADMGRIAGNLLAASLVSAFIAASLMQTRRERWEWGYALKGLIAGLAGISAGVLWVNPIGAALTGLATGFAVIFAADVLEMLRIDDSLGLFAVHGVSGAIGTLAVGLFLDGGMTGGAAGILMGGGATVLTNQFIGLMAVGLWVGLTTTALLFLLKSTGYLRYTPLPRVMAIEGYEYEGS